MCISLISVYSIIFNIQFQKQLLKQKKMGGQIKPTTISQPAQGQIQLATIPVKHEEVQILEAASVVKLPQPADDKQNQFLKQLQSRARPALGKQPRQSKDLSRHRLSIGQTRNRSNKLLKRGVQEPDRSVNMGQDNKQNDGGGLVASKSVSAKVDYMCTIEDCEEQCVQKDLNQVQECNLA